MVKIKLNKGGSVYPFGFGVKLEFTKGEERDVDTEVAIALQKNGWAELVAERHDLVKRAKKVSTPTETKSEPKKRGRPASKKSQEFES